LKHELPFKNKRKRFSLWPRLLDTRYLDRGNPRKIPHFICL